MTPSDLERPAIGRGRADSVAWLPFLLKSSHRGVQLRGLGALLPDALSARTCGVRSRACAITEWPTAFWWFRCIVSRLRMRERAWRDEERFFALLRMTMRGTTDGRWNRPRNTSDEELGLRRCAHWGAGSQHRVWMTGKPARAWVGAAQARTHARCAA